METSKTLFPQALTFNDIFLLPNYSAFDRSEINLSTNLTKKIKLQIPLISSPMDTVTESRLAIALGKIGGIGIIHRNLKIQEQADEVRKVKKEKLLAGAAVGTGQGFEQRIKAMVNAKVDVILIDSAHGFSKNVVSILKYTKKTYPKIEIIAGSIATKEGAQKLIAEGADALRVGMGPGAICTTRIISGMGVPQVTALLDVAKAAKKKKIPFIADGGIIYSGDMVKALALGASTIMMGSFFASAVESPGKKIALSEKHVPSRFKSILNGNGKYYFKQYRGMGSIGAMKNGAKIKSEDEFHGKNYKDRVLIAEGVEGYVPIKGNVNELADQAIGGIKSGMYYVGAKNIPDLWEKARFIQITQASLTESHPHDLLVANPGKNY